MTNDRVQNSLYLTAYMLNMKLEDLGKELGFSRAYMSALCNNRSKVNNTTRMSIEYLCIKHNKDYYDMYLNNPNVPDDLLYKANIFINGARKYKKKIDLEKKKDIIYRLLNDRD